VTTPAEVLAELPTIVGRHWGLSVKSTEAVHGGMNSVTAVLEAQTRRVVAKWVPQSGVPDLIRGAEVALAMSSHGIRAGRPIRAVDGRLAAPLLDGAVVILEEVSGEPLGGGDTDLWQWGQTLGRVHSVATWLQSGEFFPWLREHGTDPAREGWVQRVVEEVLSEYDELPPITWAQLHTDPEPEAFRRDERGDIGVIDWAGSVPGPVLYDLASALMYAGSDGAASRVLAGYESVGVLPELELRAHLATFKRFRAAVQAVYFSKRLHDADLTGITGQAENRQGLRDARALLHAAGISVTDEP
jgi:homoserine kinase type II